MPALSMLSVPPARGHHSGAAAVLALALAICAMAAGPAGAAEDDGDAPSLMTAPAPQLEESPPGPAPAPEIPRESGGPKAPGLPEPGKGLGDEQLKEQMKPDLPRTPPAAKERVPLSGGMTITAIMPDRPGPGDSIRIRGRNFGDSRGDKIIRLKHLASGTNTFLEVSRWTDSEIVGTIPGHDEGGRVRLSIEPPGMDPMDRPFASRELRIEEGGPRSGFAGALPEDAGRPDIPGPGEEGGGFADVPEAEMPPLDIEGFEVVTADTGPGRPGAQLAYGRVNEIRLQVRNRGERAVPVIPSYKIENALPKAGHGGQVNVRPGVNQLPVSLDLRDAAVTDHMKERIGRDGELRLRFFLAGIHRSGRRMGELKYPNSDVEYFRDAPVDRRFEFELELLRLRQTGPCRDFARNAPGWTFFITLGGLESPDWDWRDAKKPPFLDGSVRATSRQDVRLVYPVEIGASSIGGRIDLYAADADGGARRTGRSAQFRKTFGAPEGLAERTLTSDILGEEPGGAFCDGNLELRVRYGTRIIPY